MKIIANAKNGKKTGDGTGVGLFIPVSGAIAEVFPSLGNEDKSPPHTTFLYIGDITKEQEPLLIQTIQKVLEGFRSPVTAYFGGMEYFVHPAKESRVAITPVRFDADLASIRWNVRSALIDAGFDVKDSFPLVYRPHVTLSYGGLYEEYQGVVPSGKWSFSGMEVWGLPSVYYIPFGAVNQRVAKRWILKRKSI